MKIVFAFTDLKYLTPGLRYRPGYILRWWWVVGGGWWVVGARVKTKDSSSPMTLPIKIKMTSESFVFIYSKSSVKNKNNTKIKKFTMKDTRSELISIVWQSEL